MTAADGVESVLLRAERNATVRRVGVWVLGGLGFLALLAVARCDGRRVERSDAALHAAKDTLKRAEVVRERIIDTVRLATAARVRVETRVMVAHDTTRIVDTNRVEIIRPSGRIDTVTVPGAIVERLVADSALLLAQRIEIRALTALVVADSNVIHGLRIVLGATPRKRWFSSGVAIGPSLGVIVGPAGTLRAGVGLSVTVALVRWP